MFTADDVGEAEMTATVVTVVVKAPSVRMLTIVVVTRWNPESVTTLTASAHQNSEWVGHGTYVRLVCVSDSDSRSRVGLTFASAGQRRRYVIVARLRCGAIVRLLPSEDLSYLTHLSAGDIAGHWRYLCISLPDNSRPCDCDGGNRSRADHCIVRLGASIDVCVCATFGQR